MVNKIIDIQNNDNGKKDDIQMEIFSKCLKQTYPGRYKWKIMFTIESNYIPNWWNKEDKKIISLADLIEEIHTEIYPDFDIYQILECSLQFHDYDEQKECWRGERFRDSNDLKYSKDDEYVKNLYELEEPFLCIYYRTRFGTNVGHCMEATSFVCMKTWITIKIHFVPFKVIIKNNGYDINNDEKENNNNNNNNLICLKLISLDLMQLEKARKVISLNNNIQHQSDLYRCITVDEFVRNHIHSVISFIYHEVIQYVYNILSFLNEKKLLSIKVLSDELIVHLFYLNIHNIFDENKKLKEVFLKINDVINIHRDYVQLLYDYLVNDDNDFFEYFKYDNHDEQILEKFNNLEIFQYSLRNI